MTRPDAPGREVEGAADGGTRRVVWRRREGVLWRRSGDTVVLLVPDEDDLVTLSSTGQALWDALAAPADLDEVARHLGALYGVEPREVAQDVEPFLLDLERRHVVARAPW